MDYQIKTFNEKKTEDDFTSYVMGIDIGGTHTDCVIAGMNGNHPILLHSLHFKSQQLESLIPAVKETIRHARDAFDGVIESACIGASGVVSSNHDFASLTHVSWNVSAEELMHQTGLHQVYIINDFQAIGYGLNLLEGSNQGDVLSIKPGDPTHLAGHPTKAIIGAGTGLGKTLLTYDPQFQGYIPLPSEGGHTDLPVQSDEEMQLCRFIKERWNIVHPISYEDVLSGIGLERIYWFCQSQDWFQKTSYTDEIDTVEDKAALISTYKEVDETCGKTFQMFTRFYGRCAKNYVLETLAGGGLYIAGGIASRNKEIFSSETFLSEFENSNKRKDFLKSVGINLIMNYDVSLYGACLVASYNLSKKTVL